MFEGDLVAGELEVGQVSAMIRSVKPAGEVVQEFITEFNQIAEQLTHMKLHV
jgi:enoyl-[acyl-carrier protein] reductase II